MTALVPGNPRQQTLFVLGEEVLAHKRMTSVRPPPTPLLPHKDPLFVTFTLNTYWLLLPSFTVKMVTINPRYRMICPIAKLWVNPSALESH